MTPDYRPNLIRSFERHLRAENRSEHTIASYLESLRQAEAFLAARGRSLVDARQLARRLQAAPLADGHPVSLPGESGGQAAGP